MNKFLSYGRQSISEEDINAVIDVLKSDFLTQGPSVSQFEQAVCKYTGAKYAVAVANATAGLHIAVAALKIPAGMKGITTPNTFLATSNALVYNSLLPQFADIQADTYNIDPKSIKAELDDKTRVLLPVHFAGRVADMEQINSIAKEKGLYIIEDAAHAIGSDYSSGEKVGSCVYSDMTVFSFHPVKTITTGEGGIITTNNKELYNRLIMLRSHGTTKDSTLLGKNQGRWYYEMQELGFNYRMTDLQAALGLSQLKRLDAFKARRLEIIDLYHSFLSDIPGLSLPSREDETKNCYHLFTVQIDFKNISLSRDELMGILYGKGIGTQVHYIPVHTQPYYIDKYQFKEGDYPVSEHYYDKALSLPLYPDLTNDDVKYISDMIKQELK